MESKQNISILEVENAHFISKTNEDIFNICETTRPVKNKLKT
jgi:hypothetical protein